MGKRELLLVTVFVIFGVLAWQLNAPASDPNRRQWSVGGIIENIRREVRGNQSRTQVASTHTIPSPATVKEIRIANFPTDVTIVGEDRADVEYELNVESRGYDDAEAKRTAEATKVLVDQAGELLTLTLEYPREGRQTAKLAIKVPKRLALRVDEKGGRLQASHLATITIGGGRGETILSDVAGQVQASQRGSAITIANVGSLRLTTINTGEVKISGVRGDSILNFTGGEIRADNLEGTIEVESRNADMKFDNLAKARAPIRINATGGEIVLNGVQVETRIDARRAEVRVDQPTAAPLSVYGDGETIEVTLPSSGFTIDAMATAGRLDVDKALESAGLQVTHTGGSSGGNDSTPKESRASGSIKGGGPTITLRTTRGEIVLRSRNSG